MRVLHVTDTYLPRRGGIELHVHDLAQAQRREGDEADVLTLTRSRSVPPAQSAGSLLRPDDDADLVAKLRFVLSHRRHGKDAGYDVVHAHCSTFSPLVFATLASADIPTAVTFHSLWRRYTPLYRAADLALGWSTWPIAWSAVSEAAAQTIRRAAARPLTVDVVPNGIDPTAWPPVVRAARPGRLRVISVMRLAPRKRPLALLRILRAAATAMPSGTQLEAVVVGDGPQAGAMRRYIRRHGLHDVVTLAGHQPRPDIARRFSDADVFLAPATLESFGIAALEAAAAGLPVLGRCGTGLADFVTDGAGGLLVDSDEGLSQALVDLASGRTALAPADPLALAEMSWPAVVARTRALYVRAGVGDEAALVTTGGRQASWRRPSGALPRLLRRSAAVPRSAGGCRGGSRHFWPSSATRSTAPSRGPPTASAWPPFGTAGRSSTSSSICTCGWSPPSTAGSAHTGCCPSAPTTTTSSRMPS